MTSKKVGEGMAIVEEMFLAIPRLGHEDVSSSIQHDIGGTAEFAMLYQFFRQIRHPAPGHKGANTWQDRLLDIEIGKHLSNVEVFVRHVVYLARRLHKNEIDIRPLYTDAILARYEDRFGHHLEDIHEGDETFIVRQCKKHLLRALAGPLLRRVQGEVIDFFVTHAEGLFPSVGGEEAEESYVFDDGFLPHTGRYDTVSPTSTGPQHTVRTTRRTGFNPAGTMPDSKLTRELVLGVTERGDPSPKDPENA